jgi:hypothetical protein
MAFSTGKTYTIKASSGLKVRTGPGTNYRQKKRSELTAGGKKAAKVGTYAVLKNGTRVTAKAVKTVGSQVWVQIPSGWICAQIGSTVYLGGGASSGGTTVSTPSGGASAHFKKAEFKCKCGGRYCNGYPAGNTSAKLLTILEKIRAHYGKSVTIRSGQRCKKRNAQVGGVSNSMHTKGKAADIYIKGICDTAAGRKQVVRLAYKYGAKYSYANTRQMGTSVHINV